MKTIGLLLGVWLFALAPPLCAQMAQINDFSSAQFDLCGEGDSLRLQIVNTGTNSMDSLRLTVDLPEGMAYVTGSAAPIVSEIDTSDADTPVVGLADIPAGDTVLVTMLVRAGCSTDLNDLDIQYDLQFEQGGSPFLLSHLQLINSFGVPSLAILATSNTAAPFMNVGDTFTHRITLYNGSFVDMQCFELLDISDPGLDVVASNFGTLSQNGDTTWLSSDTLVPASDSIVIVLTKVVQGCGGHATTFQVNWGCKGELCNQIVRNEGTLTQVDPFSIAIGRDRTMNFELSTCRPDTVTFYYVNTGTEPNLPGSATIYNIRVGLGFNQNQYRNFDWVEMYDWHVGGTPVAPSTICDSLNPCYWNFESSLTSDPDGPGGLSDLDGDGFFDDLAVGDTLLMTFSMRQNTCWADSCPGSNWAGSIFTRLYGEDQCGDQVTSFYYWHIWGYAKGSLSQNTSVDQVDMEAGPGGDTLTQRIEVVHYRHFNRCTENPLSTFYMVLPPGVSFVGTPRWNNIPVNLADITLSNDTLFYTRSVDILYGTRFIMDVELVADCSAPSGFQAIDFGMYLICDTTCPCFEVVACGTAVPFYIHGCDVTDCLGAQARGFSLQRHNFGWANAARTIPADPLVHTNLRTDNVMTYDTLAMHLPGIMGRVTYDSLHAQFRYHSSERPGQFFYDFLEGNVEVYDSNGVLKGTCALPNADTTVLLDTVYYDFNLDRVSCGFSYEPGDSLDLRAYFRVRDDIVPATPYAMPVEFTQGYYRADSSNVLEICERWHNSPIYLLVPDPVVAINTGPPCTGWGGSHHPWTRCEPMWLKVGLAMQPNNMNCWSCDFFPGEWRDVADFDTLRVVLPEGLAWVPGTSSYYNWYYGESVAISDPIMVGDTMVFPKPVGGFPSGSSGCDYRRNLQTVYFQILPECPWDLSSADSVKVFMDWDNYLYAPDQQTHLERDLAARNFQVDFPSYSFSALTANAIGTTDTAEWVLNVHNVGTTYASAYNYIYFADSSGVMGDIEVVEVWEGSTQLALTSLGNGRSWAALDSIPPTTARQYRVRFTYSTCDFDSITAHFGYGCSNYPDSASAGACLGPQVTLYVQPEPSDLRLALVTQPTDSVDLCDTLTYELELRNVQLGEARDLLFQALLPFGGTPLQVVPGSSEIRYPINSASYSVIPDPSLVGVDQYEWNLPSNVILKGIDSLNSSRLTLRFDLVTNCGVLTDNEIQFSFRGITPCQDTLFSLAQVADPLDIRETSGVPYPYFVDVEPISPQIDFCDSQPVLALSLINRGNDLSGPLGSPDPDTTGQDDHFHLYLPPGVTYAPGTFTGLNAHGIQINPVPVQTPYGTWTRVEWQLPSGVVKQDSINFFLNLTVDNNVYACGDSIDVRMQTVAGIDASCNGLATCSAYFKTGELFSKMNCECTLLDEFRMDLQAEAAGQGIGLRWAVDAATEADAYVVYRGDSPAELAPIATKAPIAAESYSHLDPQPLPGLNFYRIQRRDVLGQTQWSEVRWVAWGTADLRLFPNPGNGTCTAALPATVSEVEVEAVDLWGRVHALGTVIPAGNEAALDLTGLANGLYWIRLTSGGQVWGALYEKL